MSFTTEQINSFTQTALINVVWKQLFEDNAHLAFPPTALAALLIDHLVNGRVENWFINIVYHRNECNCRVGLEGVRDAKIYAAESPDLPVAVFRAILHALVGERIIS